MYKRKRYFYKYKKFIKGGRIRISGRNNQGRLVQFHRGGGTCRRYRLIQSFNVCKFYFRFFFYFRLFFFYNYLKFKILTIELNPFYQGKIGLVQEMR